MRRVSELDRGDRAELMLNVYSGSQARARCVIVIDISKDSTLREFSTLQVVTLFVENHLFPRRATTIAPEECLFHIRHMKIDRLICYDAKQKVRVAMKIKKEKKKKKKTSISIFCYVARSGYY